MSDLAAQFEVFRTHAQRCRKVFDTHCRLFRNDTTATDLLTRIAHNFFYDLSDWLADYHVVLVSRLTDPATSAGKANLTSQYLVEELQKKNLQTHEIKELSDKINTYRGKVVGLRNKRIAHIDLTEAMVPISGAHHPFGEVVEFHSNLDRFCFLVGDQLGAQHLSTIQIKEGFGGVTGFLMKLKRHFKDAP